MIENLEYRWREENWFKAENFLHNLVAQYNQKLQEEKNNVLLTSFLIDAVPMQILQKLSNKYEKVHVITEQQGFNTFDNVKVHTLPTEFYGSFYCPGIPTDNHVVSKEFNCFLNRNDPTRQTWFYLLFDRGFLDRGHVSFNLSLRDNLTYPSTTPLEVFEQYHQMYLSSFDNIKEQIQSIVPYKSFVDHNDLFSVTLDSKCSIIVETYYERTDCQVFSEKTFRALQLPRPWLLFAATGSVEKLRRFGFDVYDDIVDHSYDIFDTSDNCVERQEAILEQLKQIEKLVLTESMFNRLTQGAEKNREILRNWSSSWESMCRRYIDNVFNLSLNC